MKRLHLLVLLGVLGTALAQDDDEPPPWTPEPEPVVIHDTALPEWSRLQQPPEAFSALPLDKRGRPDWSRALAGRLIEPRAELKGGTALPGYDNDVVMKNTAQMPFVKFPHQAHNAWLACSNCHDGLYSQKAGTATTTMAAIFRGESCGSCHGKVAFTPMFTCERCHSVLQPGQKPWW
ncbi:MAG: hypothetical protein HY854_08880 [Burkholderiales bacterium]|nr:hypothetical protein [Burkholderiales bacterium]